MSIKFNPNNPIIQLCMKGMALEESGNQEGALESFLKAWHQASDDYEKFIAAYHIGIRQETVDKKIEWLEKSLSFALKIDDENVQSAYPTIYNHLAKCYEEKNDSKNAEKYSELSHSYGGRPADAGPFYHGTKADLQVGDLLLAGQASNYDEGLKMNHIYFTANLSGAALAASLAKGDGEDRVYLVEPTGGFEHDPNVTDKKFPGNLTRSYRSQEPLRVVREDTNWQKLAQKDREDWDKRLAKNKGEIIN